MNIVPIRAESAPSLEPCHRAFMAMLPVILAHAGTAFRHLRYSHDREDAIAEVVALAWESFRARSSVAAKPLNPKRLTRYAVHRVLRNPPSAIGKLNAHSIN